RTPALCAGAIACHAEKCGRGRWTCRSPGSMVGSSRVAEKNMTQTRIGWIGTGVMGLSMCGHLQAKGYPVTVFSRTKSKAQTLLDKGAAWADTPAGVAAASDVIFTIVSLPSDVRAVYLEEHGILSAVKRGAITVDMTTTEPSLSRQIYDAAKAKGVSAIDAPVSGGDLGARNATLSIMVGGDEDAVEQVMPLFQAMGKNIVHQGGPGNGQHT